MTKAIRLLSRVLQLLQLRKGIALLAHVCLSMTKATRLVTRVLQLQQLRKGCTFSACLSINDQSHSQIATIGCTFSAFQIYL